MARTSYNSRSRRRCMALVDALTRVGEPPGVDEALLDEVGALIEQAPQKQRLVLTQPEVP
jgi:hypothetical protein